MGKILGLWVLWILVMGPIAQAYWTDVRKDDSAMGIFDLSAPPVAWVHGVGIWLNVFPAR